MSTVPRRFISSGVRGQRCFDTSDRDSPDALFELNEAIGQKHFKRGVSLVNENTEQLGDLVFNIIEAAGLVLVRQRPGSAKGVMFITLEDETGIANLVVWPQVFEKFRRVVMSASMIAARGTHSAGGRGGPPRRASAG